MSTPLCSNSVGKPLICSVSHLLLGSHCKRAVFGSFESACQSCPRVPRSALNLKEPGMRTTNLERSGALGQDVYLIHGSFEELLSHRPCCSMWLICKSARQWRRGTDHSPDDELQSPHPESRVLQHKAMVM